MATDLEIPDIWVEVANPSTKQAGIVLLVQYLMACMSVYHTNYQGHSDLLHCSVPLYKFVAGDRFVNLGENPTCPAGGMSTQMTLQGKQDTRD